MVSSYNPCQHKEAYLQAPQELRLVELRDANLAEAIGVDHGDKGGPADMFLVDLGDNLRQKNKIKTLLGHSTKIAEVFILLDMFVYRGKGRLKSRTHISRLAHEPRQQYDVIAHVWVCR